MTEVAERVQPADRAARPPLLVRAAERLVDPLAPIEAPPSAVRPRAAKAGSGTPPVRHTAPDAGRPPRVRRHRIDRDRLVARGFLDPSGGRTALGEELRLVKRLLVERALEPSARPRERVIAVTSALAGEGKTFIAVNLALSLSLEREARVVLIDADPIKAAAVETLGVPRAPGLAELLGPQPADPAELFVRTDLERLTVLAPGAPDPRFTELLSSRGMRAVLEAMLSADPSLVVVIDSPPLLASSEAQAVAHLAGQTVLVVAAETTPRQAVDRAIALIAEHTEVELLLNRAPGRAADAYAAYARGATNANGSAGANRIATRAGAAAGWLALLAPPVALGNWQLVPRIELGTAVTDNVRLEAGSKAEADLAGAVGVGLRAESERGPVRGRVDYAAKQFAYLNDRDAADLRHALDGTVRATLLDDRLYLDLVGEIGEVFESGSRLRPRSEFADSDARSTRIAGSFSPFLVASLGELGEGTLRYRYTEVAYLDDAAGLADARSHTLVGLVSRPSGVQRLGWTASLAADRADFASSAQTPARSTDTALATVDLSVPLSPATALLAGLGWSYMDDELLRDGGGSDPFWRIGAELRPGAGLSARGTIGQAFGHPSAEARLDLQLAPRTTLRLGYEQGLRTRFDETRSVLTDPERLTRERESEDPEARVRARLIEELRPRQTVPVDDRPTLVRRGRLALSYERERTLALVGGYLQSSRPEAGGESKLEGGLEAGLIRRLDRRHGLELRVSYDRRRLEEEDRTADDVGATLIVRREIGERARIELGYDFLKRFTPGDGDVVANTFFLRAVREF
ncbi:MAG: TIGR03016 family PEP-CTERM system-associated outer membrane protein [Geminicoccaceae bacterium]|nr:TIGR03016 family PEP-CTERM system-associated outer membrane protein [Geminicoccaceae bacterium]